MVRYNAMVKYIYKSRGSVTGDIHKMFPFTMSKAKETLYWFQFAIEYKIFMYQPISPSFPLYLTALGIFTHQYFTAQRPARRNCVAAIK